MKPFIGIKRIWYGEPLTKALTKVSDITALLAPAEGVSAFKEVRNSHEGTWGYSHDDPSVTDYINELTGQTYYRDKTSAGAKTITFTMPHAEVAALLPDNTPWSIVQRDMVDVLDEQGQPTGDTKEVVNEYDNSEYSLSGDITDHRDGTVSIKMGKPTEIEMLRAQLNEIKEAYDAN